MKVCSKCIIIAYSVLFAYLAACRLPNANVGLEISEYRVQENIRSSDFALQVCAMSSSLHFPVQVTIGISSHTAESM